MDRLERQLVTMTHPSGVEFTLNLTSYELNRAQKGK